MSEKKTFIKAIQETAKGAEQNTLRKLLKKLVDKYLDLAHDIRVLREKNMELEALAKVGLETQTDNLFKEIQAGNFHSIEIIKNNFSTIRGSEEISPKFRYLQELISNDIPSYIHAINTGEINDIDLVFNNYISGLVALKNNGNVYATQLLESTNTTLDGIDTELSKTIIKLNRLQQSFRNNHNVFDAHQIITTLKKLKEKTNSTKLINGYKQLLNDARAKVRQV